MDPFLQRIKTLHDRRIMTELSNDEIRAAVALLSVKDWGLRSFIGQLILHQGRRGLPGLQEGAHSEIAEIRRSSIHLIGKLAPSSSGKRGASSIFAVLQEALLDEDPKVRKNSAIALGHLGQKQAGPLLISALQREDIEWVRPSFLLALGAIGGPAVATFLRAYEPKYESERESLRKAWDRVLEMRSDLSFVSPIREPVPVELWTHRGLEPLLQQDVKDKVGLETEVIGPGIVYTESTDLYALFCVRTFSELLVHVGTGEIDGVRDIQSKAIELLYAESAIGRVSLLHGRATRIRYRLEIQGQQIKHYLRREIIKELIPQIESRSPELVNSPSHYDVEIRIAVDGNTIRVLWKPLVIPDDRFTYRKRDVPAAIDPVAAAGLVGFLRPERSTEHRILDPFCGSATIMIERAIAGRCKELVGIDISREAIEAAKRNVGAAGLHDATLINGDMRKVHLTGKFHEIITNMPFGIRSGTHRANIELYGDFFNVMSHLLSESGIMVLYTQEIDLTSTLFENSDLRLLNIHRLEVGGLRPAVFIAARVRA